MRHLLALKEIKNKGKNLIKNNKKTECGGS
jgi:hypothetical protein